MLACGIGFIILIVIIKGIKRVSKVLYFLSPLFILFYIVLGLVACGMHIKELGTAITYIFQDIFSAKTLISASFAQIFIIGFQRGIYSNEAGQGSGSFGASVSDVDHPARQGLAQGFSIFFDTSIICSISAIFFMIGAILISKHTNFVDFVDKIKHDHPVHYTEYYCVQSFKYLFGNNLGGILLIINFFFFYKYLFNSYIY